MSLVRTHKDAPNYIRNLEALCGPGQGRLNIQHLLRRLCTNALLDLHVSRWRSVLLTAEYRVVRWVELEGTHEWLCLITDGLVTCGRLRPLKAITYFNEPDF